MPIFLEPDQKFPIALESDVGKPANIRPTFYVKSQSMRGQRKISKVLDRWSEPGIEFDQLIDDTIALLNEVVVGWSNMGTEYKPDSIEDVLHYHEARELLTKVFQNQHLGPEEKKSSE